MRKYEVLSTTTAPAAAALGENCDDTEAPGDDSTMSVPVKLNSAKSWTLRILFSPKEISRPTEREEASATTSSAGKLRSAMIARSSRPTLPVAPMTATL